MIHEEICTYEVCKLAKEKGFDVQTFDWYDYTGNYHKGFIPHELHECPRYKEYYAPTQSLLQRWLREEKGIIIELKYSDDTECFRPFWSWQIYNTLGITLEIGEPNTTYELALEDALKYALENLM
jgi:hypothetical protein